MYKLIIIDDIGYSDNIYSCIGTMAEVRDYFDNFKQDDEIIEWKDILGGDTSNSYCKFSLTEINPKEMSSIFDYMCQWQDQEQSSSDRHREEKENLDWENQ